MSRASEGLEHIIHRILAPELTQLLDFEKFSLVSITKINLNSDCSLVDIHVSSFKNEKKLHGELSKNLKNFQQILHKKIKKKVIPQIRFFVGIEKEKKQSIIN